MCPIEYLKKIMSYEYLKKVPYRVPQWNFFFLTISIIIVNAL